MSTFRDFKDKPFEKTSASGFSVEEIARLLEMLRDNGVTEFKLERGGERLMLRRGVPEQAHYQTAAAAPIAAPVPVHGYTVQYATPAASGVTSAPVPVLPASNSNLIDVKSPMVGTFYRRPAVDSAPYVDVGGVVKKGDVLCIVEAMKLMNEIESEVAGRVAEICLQDGQMVEYGEVLFRVEPQ